MPTTNENSPAKRIALAALPWSHVARPAAALGALGAYLRRELPANPIRCFYDYVEVARAVGPAFYDHVSHNCYDLGEIIYLPLLYPERRGAAVAHLAGRLADTLPDAAPDTFAAGCATWSEVADRAIAVLGREIDRLADRLAPSFDLVGLTTCFGQTFANVALARALKARAPGIAIVLGGSSVSARVGPSLLAEYDCIDFVIQGEGERPLVELVRRLEADPDDLEFAHGILSRANHRRLAGGTSLLEVARLDDLPIPDYDAYAALARQCGITWDLPIEGSRGCWWDRVKRTGDAKDTCYFCNLNVQWNGYRQKSEERVAEEVRALGDRHANGRVFFLDNIIRHKGIERLAGLLAGLERDLELFYEMRVNVRPAQMLSLWEAGLSAVQVGIEGLSTSLLKRIGKGTTTIQNLEAMKSCAELGIANNSNLIVDFPTSTAEEVAETVQVIERYAICYQPLHVSQFALGMGATTEVLADTFGLGEIRNADAYRAAMPEATWRRLETLSNLSFVDRGPVADWSPVLRACEAWRARHRDGGDERHVLSYEDGGSYLRIRDRRDRFTDHTLRGVDRDLYLHCCEIRTVDDVVRRFGTSAALAGRVRAMVDKLVARRLMFREGERLLSLATARSPRAAARRIKATAAVASAATPSLRVVR